MKYKLLIFDWDGTLLDSTAFIVDCVQKAATDVKIMVPDTELIRTGIGVPFAAQMDRLFPGLSADDFAKFIERYREYAFKSSQLPNLFPHVISMLNQLKTAGYLLAVATSKSRKGLNIEFERHGLQKIFIASRTGDEAFAKPHPQMLLEILDELAIESKDVLMIGDTEYDLQMANNAAIKGIGVSHGVHTKEHLLKFNPLIVLDDVCKLPEWLQMTLTN